MSERRTIRVFDYVNRPYSEVQPIVSENALSVFRNATKVAALRANDLASELHVNIAGIEVGTDIAISIKSVDSVEKSGPQPELTRIELEWEAARMPRLFPFMRAVLEVYPLTSTETQLDMTGNYDPPLGVVGGALDAAIGHRIAEASVHQFVRDIAAYLRSEA
jgi:hypothetical protein